MRYIGIIPSRYGSTRLPRKALRELCGKEMFWHVYTRACACSLLSEVYLATDDERISSVAESYGIPYIMTHKEHMSGTDRIYEALHHINAPRDAIIINIQGDEPLLDPEMLSQLISPFTDTNDVQVSTLCTMLREEEVNDCTQVKVVLDSNNNALYFSRSPIPYNRTGQAISYYGHIGLYAFRYHALEQFVHFGACALEQQESLEQLRFLYHNIPIRVVHTEHRIHSVDEENDIALVEARLEQERSLYGY